MKFDHVLQLKITLEGREEATYRRGTDTVTDREVFATHSLVDTGNQVLLLYGLKHAAKAGSVADVMIGGDDDHHGVLSFQSRSVVDVKRAQSDRGRGAPPRWFGHDVAGRQVGQLRAYSVHVFDARAHEYALAGNEWQQAVIGLLQHCPL